MIWDGVIPTCLLCRETRKAEALNINGICKSCLLLEAYYASKPKLVACRSLRLAYTLLVKERKKQGKKLCCDICGDIPTNRRLSVDHNHKTMMVRGLLCIRCNFLLGGVDRYANWLNKTVRYLERIPTIKLGKIIVYDTPCEDDSAENRGFYSKNSQWYYAAWYSDSGE